MSSGNEFSQNSVPQLKISVTELVQFAARKGDLFYEEMLGPDAQEGLRGHQAIQESRSGDWQSEVPIAHCFYLDQGCLNLGGRIDLLNSTCHPPVLEEIKTCFGPGHLFPAERKALHWAQLKIYAALYSLQNPELKQVNLRVSWFDLQSNQISSEEENLSVEEVLDYCESCLQIYWKWWCLVQEKKSQIQKHCRNLAFPFNNFREGQRKLAEQVYRSIRDATHLVFEAPTGTGKTLSVLFPALKALGENQVQQLLYLTPKGSAQLNALSALESIQHGMSAENQHKVKDERQFDVSTSGAQLDILVLQAREKSCPCLSPDESQSASCQSDRGVCARTLGFYDRLPAAREEALKYRKLTAENVQTLAGAYQLCPFALTIQLLPWFSIVIADVNYFFDPLVRLSAFDQQGKDRAILIDEAHNLPSRARDMYSATLNSEELANVVKALPRPLTYLKRPMQNLLRILRGLNVELSETQKPPEALSWAIREIVQIMQQSGDNGFAGGLLGSENHAYRAWVKQLYRWIAIDRLQSSAHCFLLNLLEPNQANTLINNRVVNRESEKSPISGLSKEVCLQLRCMDAAQFLASLFEQARSSVLFSATLKPFEYSLQKFGLDPDTTCLSVPSRFPAENQLNLICRFINTQWQYRDASIENLVKLISLVIDAKEGNYLVFFPSFSYLEKVLGVYKEKFPDCKVLVQKPHGSEEERKNFIDQFKSGVKPVLGFAVVGGVFSEGVDYAGESLLGAIVIGTGMPQPSEEQQRIAKYYKQQGLNPFLYAYLYPGFVRLLQTAGRVIRSEKDRGVVVFIEPRLTRSDYRRLFPTHWQLNTCNTQENLQKKLRDFWKCGMH